MEELVSPHHVPAQPIHPDQAELFSKLEKELAALDESPSQFPPQQEHLEETIVTAVPELTHQHGFAVQVQPPKVICSLLTVWPINY